MELYKKYRPTLLKELKGNKTTVNTLLRMFKTKTVPHAFLFTGPSGCGKTTIGRIIRNKFKCSDLDFIELDTTLFRGIDTVRELGEKIKFYPVNGETKVILIDECFFPTTKVKTVIEEKEIQNIQIGDFVYSLAGKSKVLNVFKNKVALDQIIKLNFSNNKRLITTKNHLFFTNKGWIKASNLNKKHLIYPFDSDIMTNMISDKEVLNEKITSLQMQILQFHNWLLSFSRLAKKTKSFLFKRMSTQSTKYFNENRTRKTKPFKNTRSKKESRRTNKEKYTKYGSFFEEKISKSFFRKDEKKQSFLGQENNREGKKHKKNKWNITHFFRSSWWQWIFNRTPKTFSYCFGLENGSSNPFSEKYTNRVQKRLYNKKQITNQLQSRHRKQEIKNSNRSRWENTQYEKNYVKRSKENKSIKQIRLESFEIYERGNNDESFKSIITSKERNQNFITMYDLEIENHPSYFVEDIPVHNCHQLGVGGDSKKNAAQNGLLKLLEDCPPFVYFILCTTEPDMLLGTVKSRCSELQVSPLNEKETFELLNEIAKKENKKLPLKAAKKIFKTSEGKPRKAVQLLEIALHFTDESKMLKAIAEQGELLETNVKKLCQALMKGGKWKEISLILKNLQKENPETIRQGILGYCNVALLNGSDSAGIILSWFVHKNTYDSGFSLISCFCHNIVNKVEPPY